MNVFAVKAQNDLATGWHDLPERIKKIIVADVGYASKITSAHDETYWIAIGNNLINFHNDSIRFKLTLNHALQINDFIIDKRENIWIGTNNGLFVWQQGETPELHEVIQNLAINEVVLSDKGMLYLSASAFINGYLSTNFIIQYDAINRRIVHKTQLKSEEYSITNLTLDPASNIWGILNAGADSLVIIKDGQITPFNSLPNEASFQQLRGFDFDSKNNLLLVSKSDLARFNGFTWTIMKLDSLLFQGSLGTSLNPVKEGEITSIRVDEYDVIWLGTKQSGILSINAAGVVSWYTDQNSPLSPATIVKIDLDHINRKWFYLKNSTPKEGVEPRHEELVRLLSFQDPIEETMINWSATLATFKNPVIPYYSIIQKDLADNIWLYNSSLGLIKTNGNNFKTYPFLNYNPLKSALSSIAIGKKIYAGSQFNGLYAEESGFLQPVYPANSGFNKKTITHLAIDSEGALWVGHLKGVARCINGSCKYFNKKNGLLSNSITSVFIDSKDRAWIASSKGVSSYDAGFWNFYDKKKSDLKSTVIEFLEDSKGMIWAITNEGVYYLSNDQWHKLPNNKSDIGWINITCAAFDKKNNLWLGTSGSGLIQIDSSYNWSRFNQLNEYQNQAIADIAAADDKIWILISSDGTNSTALYPADFAGNEPIYEMKTNLIIVPIPD